MSRISLALAVCAVLAQYGSSTAHAAAVTVYSDVTTFTGNAYQQGGAASVNGTVYSALAADDITPLAGTAGDPITSITFSVANLNSTVVSASTLLFVFADNNGVPGTVLAALTFNQVAFSPGTVALETFTPGSTIFTDPGTMFWVGLSFTSTTATTAQLNALGQGIFAPPTVGSSQDLFFRSSGAYAGGDNPAGNNLYFGGSPTADFGFAFSGTTLPSATPEPSSLALLGSGVAALGAFGRKLRRRA